ncbi:hypothetical protein HD806DRAFT_549681 [Xylariaceae sp. AK1471]|nr:hypothetical protein HD806DRAFT_549681 [Xylariaceae sp. AK1471]
MAFVTVSLLHASQIIRPMTSQCLGQTELFNSTMSIDQTSEMSPLRVIIISGATIKIFEDEDTVMENADNEGNVTYMSPGHEQGQLDDDEQARPDDTIVSIFSTSSAACNQSTGPVSRSGVSSSNVRLSGRTPQARFVRNIMVYPFDYGQTCSPPRKPVNIAKLLKEFEYQHRVLGRYGKHLGKGANSKVTLMARKSCHDSNGNTEFTYNQQRQGRGSMGEISNFPSNGREALCGREFSLPELRGSNEIGNLRTMSLNSRIFEGAEVPKTPINEKTTSLPSGNSKTLVTEAPGSLHSSPEMSKEHLFVIVKNMIWEVSEPIRQNWKAKPMVFRSSVSITRLIMGRLQNYPNDPLIIEIRTNLDTRTQHPELWRSNGQKTWEQNMYDLDAEPEAAAFEQTPEKEDEQMDPDALSLQYQLVIIAQNNKQLNDVADTMHETLTRCLGSVLNHLVLPPDMPEARYR